MGWKKEPNIAELTPTAVIVALERDLLLSSLSRPVGSVRGIPSPAAVPAKAGPDARAAAEVIALIRRGAFVEALTCASAKNALIVPAAIEGQAAPSPDVDGVTALYASVEAAVESAGAAAAARGTLAKAGHELCILALGVAALNAFIQANVTGPDCRDAPHCPLTPSAPAADLAASADAWNKWATRSLARDGEDVVGRCFLPQYLYLAKTLLADRCAARAEEAFGGADVDVATATLAETRARAAKMAARRRWRPRRARAASCCGPTRTFPPPSLTWWASRTHIAHQRLLSGRSPTLRRLLLGCHSLTLAWFAPSNAAPGFPTPAAIVRAATARESDGSPTPAAANAATAGLASSMSLLETALMEHEYGHVDSARALLRAAGEPIGATHEVVGEMGFRTIHQTDAKAQMVLRAECTGLCVFKRPGVTSVDEAAASDDETDEAVAEEVATQLAKKAEAEAERDATGRVVNTKSAAMNRIAIELDGLSADGAQVLIAPRLGVTRADRDDEEKARVRHPAAGGAPGAGAGDCGDCSQVHGGRRHEVVVRRALPRVRADPAQVPAGAQGGGGGAIGAAREGTSADSRKGVARDGGSGQVVGVAGAVGGCEDSLRVLDVVPPRRDAPQGARRSPRVAGHGGRGAGALRGD